MLRWSQLNDKAEPYDALYGLYSGRHESPGSYWSAGTRGPRGEEREGDSFLEWPVDSDVLFQSSNFTLELWVNPAAQQEPFAGGAHALPLCTRAHVYVRIFSGLCLR